MPVIDSHGCPIDVEVTGPENAPVLMLSTMCGHGMISHSLAKKMIDFVKENRRTPEQCAATLTRFCSCGVFNPSRATRILEDARTKISQSSEGRRAHRWAVCRQLRLWRNWRSQLRCCPGNRSR